MAFRRDKTLAAAERYAARGQHAKACKEYETVVDNDPSDLRVWLLLADSLTRAGRKDEAVERYLTVARHYAKDEQPQKALAVYRQVLALEPQRLDVQLQCAKLFRELGRTSDAVVIFERIAQSSLASGNAPEAIRLYQTVIELDPASPSKRVRLAELYSRESMNDEAVEQFRYCADLLLEQGRREDYVKVGERLLFHQPDQPDVLRSLARAYLELGESRRALIKLNTLLQASPTDVDGLELLGETFLALGKLGKAVSVMVELARVQSERGSEGRAVARRVLRKALQWDLHDPQLRAMLAAVGEDSAHDRPSPASREIDDRDSRYTAAAADLGLELGGSVSTTLTLDDEEVEELDAEELEELDVDEFEVVDDDDDYEDTRVRTVPDALVDELGSTDYGAEQANERQASQSLENVVGELDEDVEKALAEVRVLIKYHLFEHALSHLEVVLGHPLARPEALRLRAEVLRRLERPGEAADALAELAELVRADNPAAAHRHARAALELDDGHVAARKLADELAPYARESSGNHQLSHAEDRSASDELALDLFAGGLDEAGSSHLDEPDEEDDDDFAIAFEPEAGTTEASASSEGEVEVEDRFGLDDDTRSQGDSEQPISRSPSLATEASSAFELDIDVDFGGGQDSVARPVHGVSPADVAAASRAPAPPSKEVSSSAGETSPHDRSPLGRGNARELSDEAPISPPQKTWADLTEEVEEIEFFLAQQLVDDARAAFAELNKRHLGHPALATLQAKLSPPASEGSPAAPVASGPAASSLPPEEEDDEDAYVAAIFQQSEPSRAGAAPTGAGASAQPLDEADASTHFDLGTAYRDMGLWEQAIREFEAAATEPRWRARSLVMVAKLQQQAGDTAAAIRTLQQGLDCAMTEDERTDANYELGVLYEKTGQSALAIAAFERVRVGFRDRDERLETLLG